MMEKSVMRISVRASQDRSARRRLPVTPCKTCGKAPRREHLCTVDPSVALYACPFCGQASRQSHHVCRAMLQEARYYCRTCGRVSVYRNALCRPQEIV